MILFKTIRWRNFLSYPNTWTEVALDQDHMSLIVGENGSGKSTILDAICFALFGKPFRNINKPTLVNAINGKNCVVEIEFETKGQQYRIIRGLKPVVFDIYCNDVLLNRDAAAKDYQEYLEKQVLKASFKAFTQIVILGSATFTPFMKLTAKDRRLVLDDLLDIQVFSVMHLLAKQQMADLKTEFQQNASRLGNEKDKEKLLYKQLSDLKKNSDDIKRTIITDIETTQTSKNGLIERKNALTEELADYDQKLAEESKLRKLGTELVPIHARLQMRLDRLKKENHFFEGNQVCSTCHQPIEEHFKIETISKNAAEIDKLFAGMKDLIGKMEQLNKRFIEFDRLRSEKNTKINDLRVTETKISETEKYLTKKMAELQSLSSGETGNQNIITKTLEYLQESREKIINLKQRGLTFVKERDNLEFTINLLKDGGIKSQIIAQYLPVINSTVNKYLSNMDFMVNFVLDENFKETIKSRYRDEFSYENFSEGEKARIDLSLLLTWRLIAKLRNSVNTNLLILDEVFDGSLDNNGSEELVNILKDVVKDSNVFVISHKETLKENFDKTIKVKKEKNYSVLEA